MASWRGKCKVLLILAKGQAGSILFNRLKSLNLQHKMRVLDSMVFILTDMFEQFRLAFPFKFVHIFCRIYSCVIFRCLLAG